MNFLPWRVKNFLSEHFPLAYHLAVNLGSRGNDPKIWDRKLEESWDKMEWPSKVQMIAARIRRDARIIDIACGSGSILRSLRQLGYNDLHGLENSTYAFERLASEGFDMHRGALSSLPFADASYDVVIASEILEHVIRRSRFMQEIRRVLATAGVAFIFVPNNCLGPIDEPAHVTKYTERTLTQFLAKFFVVESVEVFKDPNFPATFLFAYVRNREAAADAQQASALARSTMK